MPQSNTAIIQLIRHTETDALIAVYWESVLQAAGYEAPMPVHATHLAPGQCDVAVLLGVSPDLPRAREVVERVERCYPMAELVIMTHHEDERNITQFRKSCRLVVAKLLSEEQFLSTVRRAVEFRRSRAETITAPSK